MRVQLVLACALLAAAPLAGCLSDDEELAPSADQAAGSNDASTPGEDSPTGSTDEGSGDEAGNDTSSDETNATDDTSQGSRGDGSNATARDPVDAPPMAVVAHIDTGINPYHEAFRDDSELAHTHPSEYIEGYPEDARALNLTLEAETFAGALKADRDVWANVSEDTLYWIPGTRIVGAISFEDGGRRSNGSADPVMTAQEILEAVQNGTVTELLTSHDTNVLDNHGHGTMTASRAVGASTSLAPQARLVSIEGLGAEQVRWAADAGWIDVQTNSWIDRVPPPANQAESDVPGGSSQSTSEAFAAAAERMVTVAASGNGAAYTAGLAPTPTFTLATAPDGVILVGGHDNGYLAPWSGSPPHLVADGFRPLAAVFDSMTEVRPHPYSCCTSASAPYAAGAAAHLVGHARSILDDRTVGIDNGTVAEGAKGQVASGPLEDGNLTMAELREVLFHTAQERPRATLHDGRTHWAAEPTTRSPDDASQPGDNAYCPGCWSTPVRYSQIPGQVPTYLYTGYGAVNVLSDQAATSVLEGTQQLPARAQADAFYQADQDARKAYYP